MISDIHLDPFADPAKAVRLNAVPASQWGEILAGPASPTAVQDAASLQQTCAARGTDTPNALLRSSLAAIHANGAQAKFAMLSGDLLAHKFDCKYKALFPGASHAAYLGFVEKTIRYEITSLRGSLPGVPLYIAMGNNDSGCTDNALDLPHDPFLERIAGIVANALPASLPASDRAAVVHDFSAGGYYSVPLEDVPRTRLLVLDDNSLSSSYTDCSGKPDTTAGAAQLAWLRNQLAAARKQHQRVWVLAHIPPGVDLYSTVRKASNYCATGKPKMFLSTEALPQILAANADIIRLAIFGHTHSDEMRLLTPDPAARHPSDREGVPAKLIASISPINGNNPTFTLANVNPATAALTDYTVMMASNRTGADTRWAPEYTYSATYHEPAFDSASLANLIAGFQADPSASSASSQAYLRDYFPGDASAVIRFAWPQYACSMSHGSAAAFTACACAAVPK